jgi:hypothetical protein
MSIRLEELGRVVVKPSPQAIGTGRPALRRRRFRR